MSSFIEEQEEEIEVLQSIFPTEFEQLEKRNKFKIHITPGGDEIHVAVALIIEFPENYPSVVPTVEIEVEKGLGKKHADELRVIALENAESNVGCPSVFGIAEAIKDWLMDNNNPGQDGSMYAEMMRRVQQKDAVEKKKVVKAAISAAADSEMRAEIVDPAEQERIRKRQAGTQVSMETFVLWKAKFDEEMKAVAEAGKKGVTIEVDDRPTGRQLFQSNRVGTDDEEALLAAAEVAQSEEQLEKSENNIEEEDDDDEDDEDYVEGEDDDDDINDDES